MSRVMRLMTESTRKNGLHAGQRPKLRLWLPSRCRPTRKQFAWRGSSVFPMCHFCNKRPTHWLCRSMSIYFKIRSTKPKILRIQKSPFWSARLFAKIWIGHRDF
jgi:hypothetical protein